MALIRRDNVRSGEPVPIRILTALPETEPEGDEPVAALHLPGHEFEQREERLRQWQLRLRHEQDDLQSEREAAQSAAALALAQAVAEGKARGEAERARIIAEGEAQAAALVAAATEEGVAIRARAETEGFNTGMKQAEEQTASLLSELRESVDAVVDETHYQRVNLIRNAEEQVVALALEAARKIAADALRDDAAYVALLRSALARMLDKDWVRLRVSRDDLERVQGLEERMRAAVSGLDHVEIVEDPRVDHGLLVETRHGTVDATVAGQMREILLSVERALQAEAEAAEQGGRGDEA